MQTEQLLSWSRMTDTDHTSGSKLLVQRKKSYLKFGFHLSTVKTKGLVKRWCPLYSRLRSRRSRMFFGIQDFDLA